MLWNIQDSIGNIMISDQDMNQISDLIRKRELVFFTGAGISISDPSNLIMFKELQNKMIWALCQNLNKELKRTYSSIYKEINEGRDKSNLASKFMDIPPEYIFELCKKNIFCGNEDSDYYELEPLISLKNANPNLNHLYLAQFLLTGNTPAIFTTNFDLLIESGLDRLANDIKSDIQINKHCKWDHFKKNEYPSCGQYFKLHGCIEDFESIAVSLDDIGKRCTNQLPALKYYLENYYVLFTGYRGADLDIFSYLATTQCKGIIWNGYTEKGIIPKVRYLLKKQKANFIIGNITGILGKISSRLGLPNLNLDVVQKHPKRDFLNDFISWANKIEPISKITILGGLWDYIGELEIALEFFYSGYNLAQQHYDKYTETLLLGQIASIFYKKKEYGKVRKLCNLALDDAKKFPEALQLYQYIHTFQMLGLVAAHTNLKTSANFFKKALDSQEKLEKINPPSRYKKAEILSNVANVFYRAGLLDDSKGCCKNALEIYDEFGDVQGRASVLVCIGDIFLEQKKYNDCLVFYKEAEYLFNETGNIFNLPKILRNIAIVFFKKDHRIEARKYAEKSLVYCEIISDQERCNKVKQLLHLINK